jgi:hypothetical protein
MRFSLTQSGFKPMTFYDLQGSVNSQKMCAFLVPCVGKKDRVHKLFNGSFYVP